MKGGDVLAGYRLTEMRTVCVYGYAAAYCGLVATTVLLPSAKLQNFNVKFALAFVLFGFGAFVWRSTLLGVSREGRLGRLHLAVLAYLAAIVAFWSVVAVENSFSPLPEVRSILGPLFLLAAYHPRLVPKSWLLLVYCISAIGYSLAKLLVLLGVYADVFQTIDLIRVGQWLFEMELMFGPGCPPGVVRLTLANDLAVVMFPLLLLNRRYRRPSVYVGLAICALAIMPSYSRYLMLAFIAVCLIVGSQLAPVRAQIALGASVLAGLGVAYAIGGSCFWGRLMPSSGVQEDTAAFLAPRCEDGPDGHWSRPGGRTPGFWVPSQPGSDPTCDMDPEPRYMDGASVNRYTDGVREEQWNRIKELIVEKPIMGHGVGSYHRDYVRSSLMPYSYELQLLSFVFKFGLVGFVLLSLGVCILCLLLFGRNVGAWAVLATLGASGVGNPFYESTAFGVAFVLTLVTFSQWPNTNLERGMQ